jgi:hypothetical protein
MQKQMYNGISVILADECVTWGIGNARNPVKFVVLQVRRTGMFLSGNDMS